jgi:serine/threonine-protein kinase ATR
MVSIPELSEVTLDSWYRFLMTLGSSELGPHVGPTSAAIVTSWPSFSDQARETAYQSLEYLICTTGISLKQYIAEIADISIIKQLGPLDKSLKTLRGTWTPEQELHRILKQMSSDNLTVATLALRGLIFFMLRGHKDYIRRITSAIHSIQALGKYLHLYFLQLAVIMARAQKVCISSHSSVSACWVPWTRTVARYHIMTLAWWL